MILILLGPNKEYCTGILKSSNILLDEDWSAMIADFGLSKFCPANLQYSLLFSNPAGTFGYCDPLYFETGLLTKESDVYSFGVVLFEVLCGRLCNDNIDKSQSFIELIRKHYKYNSLKEIVFGNIRDEINTSSLKVFSTIAYQCLKRDREKRPLMSEILTSLETALNYQNVGFLPDTSLPKRMSITHMFKHLEIQLEDIISATNNFDKENIIGEGGFGKVYKGELSHSKGHSTIALKRLDPKHGQGAPEFWKEILMLSIYKHENIVPLIGYCDESGEKILVIEYASKRSLDLYLNNDDLTWVHRLKICIGVAHGLAFLHNPPRTQQKVLHRDIKSTNILLDENWNAMITDFGLSEFSSANQQYPFNISSAVGTFGYIDPLYAETSFLTEESDVYSFGVVLFEVLCGRLCYDHTNGMMKTFISLVRECYEIKNLDEIIHGSIKYEINPSSLNAFATIAYRCLNKDREERPLMKEVVRTLETALKYQVPPPLPPLRSKDNNVHTGTSTFKEL